MAIQCDFLLYLTLWSSIFHVARGTSANSVEFYPSIRALPEAHIDAYPHQTDRTKYLHFCRVTPLMVTHNDLQCIAPKNWFPLPDNYELWSQRPMCIYGKSDAKSKGEMYCLFVSTEFAERRGIALFTTPRIARTIVERGSYQDQAITGELNDIAKQSLGSPGFELRSIPNKGMGVSANQNLPRGHRVMQETASWVVNHATFSELKDEDRIPMQWHGMYMLPRKTRDELLALDKYPTIDEIDGLGRTNSFSTWYADDEDDNMHWSVFPRISRFNHDCRPNADYHFDEKTLSQYVVATKEIAPGEEISISYIHPCQDYNDRQASLKQAWRFDCKCSICSKSAKHISASNKRIRMINSLQDSLDGWSKYKPPNTTMTDMFISLYAAEDLETDYTRYQAAAYAYSAIGNKQRAALFAMKGIETWSIAEHKTLSALRDLESLVQAPTKHYTWLYQRANITES